MTTLEKPKFPKFMAHLTATGLDMKLFSEILQNKGYSQYKYHTVLRKLNGTSNLHYDDIIVFSEVLDVDVSIFFE